MGFREGLLPDLREQCAQRDEKRGVLVKRSAIAFRRVILRPENPIRRAQRQNQEHSRVGEIPHRGHDAHGEQALLASRIGCKS